MQIEASGRARPASPGEAYPFDCGVPCLAQCDHCDDDRRSPENSGAELGGATRCLTSCFHQCTQSTTCVRVCEKTHTACGFLCKKIRAGSIDTLTGVFEG